MQVGLDEFTLECFGRVFNIRKANIPPFSISGDYNDAEFPMPDHFQEYLKDVTEKSSDTSYSTMKLSNICELPILTKKDQRPEIGQFEDLFGEPELIPIESQNIPAGHYVLSQLFPEYEQYCAEKCIRRSRLPMISLEVLMAGSVNLPPHAANKKLPLKHKKNLRRSRVPNKKYIRPTRDQLFVYLNSFARRIQDNFDEFQRFCSLSEVHQ